MLDGITIYGETMSQHPNTFLAADITGPDLDKLIALLTQDEEVSFTVDGTVYQGSQGNDDQHYIQDLVETLRLYNYVTYGYGEVVSFDKVADAKLALSYHLNKFCLLNNLNVRIKYVLGATYW